MSDVTLHASFVEYGSPWRRFASLDRLEAIAGDLEWNVEQRATATASDGRCIKSMQRQAILIVGSIARNNPPNMQERGMLP